MALLDFAARIAGALQPYGLTCGDAKGANHLVLVERAMPSTFKDSIAPHGRYRYEDMDDANTYVPHADDPGTYIFFDEKGKGRYVGKAEVGFGWRIASHMRAGAKEFKPTDYLIVIPFKTPRSLPPPSSRSCSSTITSSGTRAWPVFRVCPNCQVRSPFRLTNKLKAMWASSFALWACAARSHDAGHSGPYTHAPSSVPVSLLQPDLDQLEPRRT